MRAGLGTCVLVVLLAGCGTSPTPSPASSPAVTASDAPPTSLQTPPVSTAASGAAKPDARSPRLGVDVSHHKGHVDWKRVRADGISFAYLKASEGTGFVDPAFADNLHRAKAAGLRVGGYHYFTLCGSGEPQASHFLSVIGSRTTMPPAVDVEFIGNCSPGPSRTDLLTELRTFIDTVETATGKRVVVYLYPEVEAHYRLAEALDRRQWVRSLDGKPLRSWWIWQKSDRADIDGIGSPADLNQMR